MDCSPKAKLQKTKPKKVTYVGNCLTWLIVKLVLLSVNAGGSGLWLCMLLCVALIACSNNWTALRAVYKKKKAIFLLENELCLKMNYVVVDTSHSEHFLPFAHLLSFVFRSPHVSGHQPVCLSGRDESNSTLWCGMNAILFGIYSGANWANDDLRACSHCRKLPSI